MTSKPNPTGRKFSWSLIRFVGLSVLLAALCAPFFQPWYHHSRDAASILATVISILAGFLIAVMAIVGDERALRGKTWRQDTFYLLEIKRQLLRHRLLFHLYLVVLVLLFVASLSLPWSSTVQVWVERAMLFFAVFALLCSFRLPGELTGRQMSALRDLIDKRRADEQNDEKD